MPITAQTQVSDTILASPDRCFGIATDLAAYPGWVPAITSVDVRAIDDLERPVEVEFQAEAMGRRTRYVLAYDYAEAPHGFSWRQTEGDLTRRLEGSYRFAPSDEQPGATAVTYELDIELAVPLPGFVKRRAETKIVQAALSQFRQRVESS